MPKRKGASKRTAREEEKKTRDCLGSGERERVCVWVCRDIGASVSGDKQEATGSFLEITGHGKLWAGGDE